MMTELEKKLQRIRSLMVPQALDAVYLKRQDNFAWLTCGGKNYVGIGEIGNCGLLVTKDSLYAITNTIEQARMVAEENLEEMGFTVHFGPWHDNGFESKEIERIIGKGSVGFDHGNAMGTNIAPALKSLRFTFTEEEIERYREIGYLASLAMEETAATIRPGDTEYETVGRLAEILHAQGMDFASAMCAADDRISNYRHPVPTMRRIERRVQLGGNIRGNGMVVCLTRFVNFGPIDPALHRQYRDNVLIDLTLMKNTVVGASYQKPLQAAKEAYAQFGYADEFEKHHQGGPIGYNPREFRLDYSHTGTIVENQGFCWNPSITGTKSEDTILVDSNGFSFITRPIIYPVLEVEFEGTVYHRADILEK